MNNFDIEDAVLIMLKKLFYRILYLLVTLYALQFCRTYNPLVVLSKYIRISRNSAWSNGELEDLPLKELYRVYTLTTCK
jgi:hypothetical protein